MEMAKVKSKGQITVPIDVRVRLGLNEGSNMLFIEQGNGFFVVNENRINTGSISGAKKKVNAHGWSDEFVKEFLNPEAQYEPLIDEEYEDIPWTEREELL